jgi:hypothetical protein
MWTMFAEAPRCLMGRRIAVQTLVSLGILGLVIARAVNPFT